MGLPEAASVFIGRSAELQRVAELLDSACRGRAGGLFILGDAGVGKSRLVAEAQRLALERGVRVARAACLRLTTPLPLDPVLDLLRSLGQPVGFAAGDSPREAFWTVLGHLEQASVPGPLLLCLDDVQWSDAATIDLVHYCQGVSATCRLHGYWRPGRADRRRAWSTASSARGCLSACSSKP